MIIQSNGDIEIKSKSATFRCHDKRVNSVNIAGPGEYEVSDMSIRVLSDGILQISAEGLGLAYIHQSIPSDRQDILDNLAESDILLMELSNKTLNVADSQKLIQVIEPQVIISTNHELKDQFCKMIGECPSPVKIFKITKSQLLTDETQRVILLS